MKTIILAGGCFWGVEAYYSRLKGVVATEVGYIDGPGPAPSYADVRGGSGHAEACRVVFDETVLPLAAVLDHFFRIVDPTQLDRQAHDIGRQYRNGIYYLDPADRGEIEARIDRERKIRRGVVRTYAKPAGVFHPAEDYHQDYLEKNPGGYCHVDLRLLRPDEKKEGR
jgi:methionine-S-sulfoxide reductase